MERTLPKPRRDLEFVPIQDQGRDLILIRDRLGFVSEGLAIAPQLFHFLQLLESMQDLQELQLHLSRQAGGQLISREEIEKLVHDLDQSSLLDSNQYRTAKASFKARFTADASRQAVFAGRSYPADAQALCKQLAVLFPDPVNEERVGKKMKGLVAPHIDLSVGGKGYAAAYSCFGEQSVDRVLVLGIGHQMERVLFALTHKTYETVFGGLAADRDAVDRLRQVGGQVLAETDFDHCHEHSIEFQALFLKYLQPEAQLQMIPILCGSVWGSLQEYSRQAFWDEAGPFLEELRTQTAREGTLVIAGVDFSHIGPKFGHQESALRIEPEAQHHDYELLSALCNQDPETFWKLSREVQDRYHVCGFSALATFLEILPELQGELLHYEMWHEQATRSAVSFAALGFSQPEK